MLNSNEAARVQEIAEELPNPVEVVLYPAEEKNEFSSRLADFVDAICGLSRGKIRSIAGSGDFRPSNPCFGICTGTEKRPNIIYAALPTGHQFLPFTRALELAAGRGRSPAAGGRGMEIQVLISEHCPRCPTAVEAAVQLSGQHSWISSTIVDTGQFPGPAQQFGIKSVPATILDGRLVLTGSVSAGRLMELVNARGTLGFEMEIVRSLIETGKITEAADCLGQQAGREVVLASIQSPDFSKRLSALVVIERALGDRPDRVRALVPSLLAMLSHDDARIRGDVADLLGKIGDPQAIEPLERLVSDPDPDVAEAAAEALAELVR